jgi:hypothetical protein
VSLTTILQWTALGAAFYRMYGPDFWADVRVPWNPVTGYSFEYVNGNYTGDLGELEKAVLAEIGG